MSRLTDFFKTGGQYEHSPMMHVQDQKASGTSSQAIVVSSDNIRELSSTPVTNEIVGASISSNLITLPSGVYYIEANAAAQGYNSGTLETQLKVKNGSEVLLSGETVSELSPASRTSRNSVSVSGNISLSVGTSSISLSQWMGAAAGSSFGSVISSGDNEVYSDLKIWQLDAIKTSPIIHDNKLYPLPGNTYVTGDMYGLEYSYTSANSITVDAGICYDSLNTTLLTGSASQVVAIGTTINQIYNLFLCDDGLVKTDTDVEGTTLLAGSVTALRWIGFVLTNSAGNIVEFKHSGDILSYPVHVVSGIGTTKTAIDFSGVVPVSRVNSIATRVELNTNSAVVYFYNTSDTVGYIRANTAGDLLIMRHMNIVGYAVHTNTGVVSLVLTECILKR